MWFAWKTILGGREPRHPELSGGAFYQPGIYRGAQDSPGSSLLSCCLGQITGEGPDSVELHSGFPPEPICEPALLRQGVGSSSGGLHQRQCPVRSGPVGVPASLRSQWVPGAVRTTARPHAQ